MKILCNGCSNTYGAGFLDHERNDKIWPTIIGKQLDAQVTNIAYPGKSNLEIFLSTLRAMDGADYDLVVVQWTTLRRHWFEPGLNRYYITAGDTSDFKEDWQHKDIFIKKSKRKEFFDIITVLTGDYRAILDLVLFCQTLIKLAKSHQKILFVNNRLDWTPELIYPPQRPFDMEKVFSKFTKDMLEFETLDDDEIMLWFDSLNSQIVSTLPHWINITDPWKNHLIDTATLGHHAGPLSHLWLANQILQHLVDQKITF